MLAGLETAKPGDAILTEHRSNLDRTLIPVQRDDLFSFEGVVWPPPIATVMGLVRTPFTLREVLQSAAKVGDLSTGDVLRATEILLAAGLLAWM